MNYQRPLFRMTIGMIFVEFGNVGHVESHWKTAWSCVFKQKRIWDWIIWHCFNLSWWNKFVRLKIKWFVKMLRKVYNDWCKHCLICIYRSCQFNIILFFTFKLNLRDITSLSIKVNMLSNPLLARRCLSTNQCTTF